MSKSEKILTMDIGSASIKLAEFEVTDQGGMTLTRFGYREFEEELSDTTRMNVIAGLLRQMLAEGGYTAKKVLLCLSGQLALIRFTRLPVANCDKKQIRQMAEFEATQNIPFDIRDVILDYQLIGFESGEAVDIMSVVIKNEIVEQYTDALFMVDCEPILIDISPASIYNVGRGCGLGDNECSMILNIGGRVSNLVFMDGDRFYSRTIPIAGYTITQQIAKEFDIEMAEAEELKRHHGFVALGGAYADPDSETAARVSRIVRNVMARLHGEISRTINVYRSQQKGNAPAKLYLAGGSSILTYCDTFFNEKLNIPVEYFNPFRCVTIGEEVDRNRLQEVGHTFAEVIGLGLRYAAQCPVELTLVPGKIRRQQRLEKRKPFFVASIIVMILLLLVVRYGVASRVARFEGLNKWLTEEKKRVDTYAKPIEDARFSLNDNKGQLEGLKDLLNQQSIMPSIINEIYRLKPDYVWITGIQPIRGKVKEVGSTGNENKRGGEPGSGGMFDGSGGMPGGMASGMMGPDSMMMENTEGDKNKVVGFVISGCSVKPDKGDVHFTLGKETPFLFKVEKALPPEVSGDKPSMTLRQYTENAMKKAGNTPELVFEAALRNSMLFDSNDKMTAITYDKIMDNVPNYSEFKIQVKLNMEIEAKVYEQPKSM